MKSSTIEEINRYTNPESFLVVGINGRLQRIRVPFKVKVLYPLGESWSTYQILEVRKIKTDQDYRIMYLISNKLYYPAGFEIL